MQDYEVIELYQDYKKLSPKGKANVRTMAQDAPDLLAFVEALELLESLMNEKSANATDQGNADALDPLTTAPINIGPTCN